MYPVEPGSGQLVLGSPLFEQTVVRPAQGEPTTLDAPKAATRPYIDQAAWTSLDGHVSKGTSRSFVTTQQLRTRWILELEDVGQTGRSIWGETRGPPHVSLGIPGFWRCQRLKPQGHSNPRALRSNSNTFSLTPC